MTKNLEYHGLAYYKHDVQIAHINQGYKYVAFRAVDRDSGLDVNILTDTNLCGLYIEARMCIEYGMFSTLLFQGKEYVKACEEHQFYLGTSPKAARQKLREMWIEKYINKNPNWYIVCANRRRNAV